MPDWWDPYSSQPYQIPRSEKPRLGAENLLEYVKVLLTAVALTPALVASYALSLKTSKTERKVDDFVGLSVTPSDEYKNAIVDMVGDLGVQKLLLRIPCWEADHLDLYHNFIDQFPNHEFLINILQSRDSVLNPDQWNGQVQKITRAFQTRCKHFQLGNAINRSKWGCRHSGDWLKLMDRVTPDLDGSLRILGSSVIDFEPLLTLRTLCNFHRHKFDICAALLYVNRRGSPFGKQYAVFDLERKIRLTYAMLNLSTKCKKRLWISETNWPLLDTKPWTLNSGHPRSTVDEKTQAQYLTEYFQIAWHTNCVERVYWWQLINPGYGLVDHRNSLRKMPSYFAFKRLLAGELEERPSSMR